MPMELALDYGTFPRDNTSRLLMISRLFLIKLTCLVIATEPSVFSVQSEHFSWFELFRQRLGLSLKMCVHFIISFLAEASFIQKRNSWKSTIRFDLNEAAWSTFCSILVYLLFYLRWTMLFISINVNLLECREEQPIDHSAHDNRQMMAILWIQMRLLPERTLFF